MSSNGSVVPLAVVGCDFRVISSRWRSLLVLQEGEARHIAAELGRGQAADGFADLGTCNRNEWIVSSQEPTWAAELLRSWMLDRLARGDAPKVEPYRFVGEEAVRHILRVVLGQESFVRGERQIANQLFRAMEVARNRGTASRILNGLGSVAARLVQSAGRRGLLVRTSRGVHSLAVSYLHRARPAPRRVAVVGLGAIGRQVRGLLEAASDLSVVPCNRTVPEGQVGRIRPITDLAAVLAEVDAAVICTGAHAPVVRPEHLGGREEGRPLLLIDLGIPEQVVRDDLPPGVSRAGLDELTPADSGKHPGVSAEAERLIDGATARFRRFCNERDVRTILTAVHEQNERLVGEDLQRLVEDRFSYLDEAERAQLELDLRGLLQAYTHRIFGAIKGATAE